MFDTRTPPERAPRAVIAACVIVAAMLAFGLGAPPLMQPDEGRNAEVAREMAAHHSWTEATLEGLPYLDKPAGYFALVAASLRLFGDTEAAARLTSALSGLGTLLLLFFFVRRRLGERAASYGTIAAVTSPLFFAFSRIVIVDMLLCLLTTAAILAAFVAEEREGASRRRWYLAACAAAGLGFAVKGPVGVLVPLVVFVPYLLIERRRGGLRRLFSPGNVVLVAAIAGLWFWSVARVHPDFVHYGIVEETLERFFTPSFNRTEPFWYYAPAVVVAIFPWSLLLPPLIAGSWRARRSLRPAEKLLMVWTVADVVFFSLSRTKQPGYILAAIGPLGALIGIGLVRALSDPRSPAARRVARWTIAWAALAVALGAIVTAGAFDLSRLPGGWRPDAGDAGWVRQALPGFAAGLVTAALCGLLAGWRRIASWTAAAFSAFPLAMVTLALPGLVAYAEGRSARPLARALAGLPRDATVAFLSSYSPGLSFYRGATAVLISDDGSQLGSNYVVSWLKRASPRPESVVPWAARADWLAARTRPTYLLARAGERDELSLLARAHGSRASRVEDDWWGALVEPPRRP